MRLRITTLHPSYRELLRKALPVARRYFTVSFLPVRGERFGLLKLEASVSPDAPLLMLMAGCHGEEPAPVLSLFRSFPRIARLAARHGVNVVIYPLVNPWGFDRNHRYNRHGLNCNRHWMHTKGRRAEEVRAIMADCKTYRPKVFASLHEDDDTRDAFYLFSFGNRLYEKRLLETGKRYFPLLADGVYGDDDDERIVNGVCYDEHDGSAEDFMSHQGCTFTCCTETTSHALLSKRIRCYESLIPELIREVRND